MLWNIHLHYSRYKWPFHLPFPSLAHFLEVNKPKNTATEKPQSPEEFLVAEIILNTQH